MATRWRASEDEQLRALYAAGVPLGRISIRLGRSEDAVNARRAQLGLPVRRAVAPWSELADALLREATLAGVPATQLAQRLHRTVEQVRSRRRALGLVVPSARAYTPVEDAALAAAWASGAGIDDLARRFGRSRDALLLRARVLGFHRPEPRRRWSSEEDALLRDGYAAGLTCEAIAGTLAARTPTAVAARARKLGLATYARRWSDLDDARLARALSRHAIDEVARALGRTPEAIRRRAAKLGLDARPTPHGRRGGARWTPDDDEFLRLHPGLNPALLATLLDRSDRAVAARLRQLGLRAGRRGSPHHPVTLSGGLSPGERALINRELRARGQAAARILERRLGHRGPALAWGARSAVVQSRPDG
jgi:hypothetical protein